MTSFAAAFADVTPIEQDDGPRPVCAIAYPAEYARLMGFFRAVMASAERSPRVLELTAALAEHNAAHYTVWHVRRECLWALALSDDSVLSDELRYSAEVARENPKNYQIWYHRRALVEKVGQAAAQAELALIGAALRDDAKNYHAWSNRLWVLKTFGGWAGELVFINALLDADVHNNSAWNHLYQVKMNTPCDAVSEVRFALDRLARAGENESAWVYALAFAKRDAGARAVLLAHCEAHAGDSVRVHAARVDLLAASDPGRAAAAARRLVTLDASRARFWRRCAEGLSNSS